MRHLFVENCCFAKSCLSVLIILQIMSISCFTSYADTATASDWILDDFMFDGSVLSDYDSGMDSAMFSPRVATVTNTVDFSGAVTYFHYFDSSNVRKTIGSNCNSDGTFSSFARPADYVTPGFYVVWLTPKNLPPAGTYRMTVHYGSYSGVTYTEPYLYSRKTIPNASNINISAGKNGTADDFSQFSGDFSFSSVMEIGSGIQYLEIGVRIDQKYPDIFPLGGQWYINFTKVSETPDYTTAGGPQTSEDVQQDTANNTAQIADNTAEMNGTLKEIVQTISNQLHALWDQMYNYMHVPHLANDDKNTQRIIDRLDDGFDVSVDNVKQNIDKLIRNDDKNTNTVVNGYDNSGMNSTNDKLNGSVQQYDKAETDVFDSVKDNVTNFQIPEFTNSVPVLAAISFSSSYLQRLFDAIGLFNVPITVSLVMIFVLMVLGYYRVRN